MEKESEGKKINNDLYYIKIPKTKFYMLEYSFKNSFFSFTEKEERALKLPYKIADGILMQLFENNFPLRLMEVPNESKN